MRQKLLFCSHQETQQRLSLAWVPLTGPSLKLQTHLLSKHTAWSGTSPLTHLASAAQRCQESQCKKTGWIQKVDTSHLPSLIKYLYNLLQNAKLTHETKTLSTRWVCGFFSPSVFKPFKSCHLETWPSQAKLYQFKLPWKSTDFWNTALFVLCQFWGVSKTVKVNENKEIQCQFKALTPTMLNGNRHTMAFPCYRWLWCIFSHAREN